MLVPLIMQIQLDQLKRRHVGIQLWRYGEGENTLRVKQQLVINYSALLVLVSPDISWGSGDDVSL